MERILKRYFFEDVNKIIDKHISIHREFLHECDDIMDCNCHASAMAALEMLKKELNGEKKY